MVPVKISMKQKLINLTSCALRGESSSRRTDEYHENAPRFCGIQKAEIERDNLRYLLKMRLEAAEETRENQYIAG